MGAKTAEWSTPLINRRPLLRWATAVTKRVVNSVGAKASPRTIASRYVTNSSGNAHPPTLTTSAVRSAKPLRRLSMKSWTAPGRRCSLSQLAVRSPIWISIGRVTTTAGSRQIASPGDRPSLSNVILMTSSRTMTGNMPNSANQRAHSTASEFNRRIVVSDRTSQDVGYRWDTVCCQKSRICEVPPSSASQETRCPTR